MSVLRTRKKILFVIAIFNIFLNSVMYIEFHAITKWHCTEFE